MSKVILIVEDDPEFREVMAQLLSRAGYTVLEANHGREALEVMGKNKVDLVLSDIKMPQMDGFELLKHIQSIGEGRPKVVMMTGYSIHTKEEAMKAGAETLLEKPGIGKTLIDLLSTIRFY